MDLGKNITNEQESSAIKIRSIQVASLYRVNNNYKFVMKIKNEDGSISMNAEDTAIGFGWIQDKNGKTYVKWERVNSFCKEFGFSPQVGKDDFIPETLFYLLGMKASNETARKFQCGLQLR